MISKEDRRQKMTIAILSLSLLTVMAGAAVAPALGVIKEYFSDVDQTLVQMIISIPALFIALTNIIFPKLSRIFHSRDLVLFGLALYTVGGCLAGAFSNIYVVLIFRALVGVGVGIIMPMSTGLLSYYYTRDKQDKLMGYSSAMNQMGGVIATLIAGLLSSISWRASFLVYLMGLISIVLCLRFLPNEKIGHASEAKSVAKPPRSTAFIIAMFLLMFTFFVYPSSFAIESAKSGRISHTAVTVIMSGMDLVAFAGGLSFVHIKKRIGNTTKLVAPILFTIGYVFLFAFDSLPLVILGSALIGFANGCGIPYLISTAAQRAGKLAATTVIPKLSMAMYFAQFFTPMILSAISGAVGQSTMHIPYATAVCSGILFILTSLTIKSAKPVHQVIQEEE